MGSQNNRETGNKIKRSLTSNNNKDQAKAKLLSNEKIRNFIKTKKNSKLRLFFIGENAETFIFNLFDPVLEKNTELKKEIKNDVNYKTLLIKKLKWTIYILNESISDDICTFIIDEIKKHFRDDSQCYDALVPLIKNLNEVQTVISNIEKVYKQKRKQPFILFLSKTEETPNRESYQKLVTATYFDKRNILAESIKIDDLKDEKTKNGIYKNIFSKIWNIFAYYNGMGDLILVPSGFIIEKRHLFPYQLNILTCGKPGLGKSSFINIVLKEKRAKEGEGLAVTSEIVRYSHPYFPIAFYDTPGTDSSEAVKMLNDELELYNVKLKEAKKKIHLILWFIRYDKRVDVGNENLLMKNLLNFNAEFLFVINFVDDPIESEEFKTKKEIILESLTTIFKGKVPDLEERIVFTNLIKEKVPVFGLDNLFYKIHFIFKKYIEKFNTIQNGDQLSFLNELSKNKLLSELVKAEDLKIYLRIEASRLVLNTAKDIFFSIFRESKREAMIKELISIYFGEKKIEGLGFFEDFINRIFKLAIESEINKKGDKFYSNLFFKSLKEINNIYEFNFDYEIIFYNTYTIAVGYLVIEKLEQYLQKEENLENSLINAMASYITAIETIKLIGDDFKNYYH